jgi:hypothetical protein
VSTVSHILIQLSISHGVRLTECEAGVSQQTAIGEPAALLEDRRSALDH